MNDPRLPDNFTRDVPEGDNVERDVCGLCGFVHYQNPKIVVGSVICHEERYLLCRRAIEPGRGRWTLPAGYMENGETTEAAALREAREEAEVDIRLGSLLAVYSLPHISQVQLFYLARLNSVHMAPGPESLEVGLFAWEDIPWSTLAFPTVRWALHHARDVKGRECFPVFGNPSGESADMNASGRSEENASAKK